MFVFNIDEYEKESVCVIDLACHAANTWDKLCLLVLYNSKILKIYWMANMQFSHLNILYLSVVNKHC